MTNPTKASVRCACGACRFDVELGRAARFVCHCTICQRYTGRDSSDVTVVSAAHVTARGTNDIVFERYRPPPNIERGRCRSCGQPAIERGGLGPVKLVFVPTPNFEGTEGLPPIALHMFYHRRVADVDDALPKHSGYLRSQLAIAALLWRVV